MEYICLIFSYMYMGSVHFMDPSSSEQVPSSRGRPLCGLKNAFEPLSSTFVELIVFLGPSILWTT